MNSLTYKSQREPTIDAIRGIAVLGMIIAHAIFFFHTQTHSILNGFEIIANTIVLTLFVFVSGSSYSKTLDLYSHGLKSGKAKRILSNVGLTYIAYLIVSTVGILTSTPIYTFQTLYPKLMGAITFTSPTNFTEYMILFLYFPLSGLFFRRFYSKCRSSFVTTAISSIILYAIGMVLYPLVFPYPIQGVKEILAGGISLLRFPLLFYYPVYLFGLWWEFQYGQTDIRRVNHSQIITVISASVLLILFTLLTVRYDIPLLSVFVRWPPSIGFLLTGLTTSMLLSISLPFIHPDSAIRYIYRYITYLGRDSLDLWMTHLLILFTYKMLIGTQYNDFGTVMFLVVMTILTSTLISSIRLTNTITLTRFGPVLFSAYPPSKLRKRYILFFSAITTFIMFSLTQHPPQSLYGEKLPQQTFSMYDQPPVNASAVVTSNRKWFVRSGPWISPIQMKLKVANPINNTQYSINPSNITFTSNDQPFLFQLVKTDKTELTYELSPDAIPAGKYFISATISTSNGRIYSNIVPVTNSEPFMVAWTFDWEGWDASDETMQQISSISQKFGNIPFTHFVNPRTFITDTISEDRKNTIRQFLSDRAVMGDEIALHIHMQYDLVTLAGVEVNKTKHWGLLSNEGYDVPTTFYSTDDFRKIVKTGMTLLQDSGFSNIHGYRAGGWFINSEQLTILKELGLSYDTSGRDKPSTGAFSAIPWTLPIGAQPYYPDSFNQNLQNTNSSGILEIPDNGVTTYESSSDELITRIRTLYPGGFLTKPTVFVVTSHPQFSGAEFHKIPTVLTQLERISAINDSGPVVFDTMDSIYSLWTSSTR